MHGSKFIIKALNKQNSKLVVCGYSIIIRKLHVSPCADLKGDGRWGIETTHPL